jgi:hypothetical protein
MLCFEAQQSQQHDDADHGSFVKAAMQHVGERVWRERDSDVCRSTTHDAYGQRLMPMLLPSVYRIGSSSVSTRN